MKLMPVKIYENGFVFIVTDTKRHQKLFPKAGKDVLTIVYPI